MANPFAKAGKIGKRGLPIGFAVQKPKPTFKNQQRAVELRREGASADAVRRALRGESGEESGG